MGAAKVKKANGAYPAQTAMVVPVKSALPYYTNKSVVALFRHNDPRIVTNDYGTSKSIVLSDVAGYFKYSDERGGIATFYRGDTDEPVSQQRVRLPMNSATSSTTTSVLVYGTTSSTAAAARHITRARPLTLRPAWRFAIPKNATASTRICLDCATSASTPICSRARLRKTSPLTASVFR